MSQEKISVGRVEVREGQYGPMTTISLGPQDTEKIAANLNEKGWINLSLKESRAGGFYLEVYKAKANTGAPAQEKEAANLPF